MDAQGKGVFKVVGAVFAPIGFAMLGFGGWSAHRHYTILKYWPTVEAQVANSRITHSVSHDSDHNSDTNMYGVEIEFQYTVNGKEYLTPSGAGYTTSSYTEMKRMADEHAPGTRSVIKYNPSDPNDIRFNAGYTLGFFFLPVLLGGLGLVFGGLGTVFLFVSRSAPAPRCPSCGQAVQPGQHYCPNCATPLRAT